MFTKEMIGVAIREKSREVTEKGLSLLRRCGVVAKKLISAFANNKPRFMEGARENMWFSRRREHRRARPRFEKKKTKAHGLMRWNHHNSIYLDQSRARAEMLIRDATQIVLPDTNGV